MCFDDPIYLDRDAVDELMGDTDQHRICWMYHDILSDPNIARMFDQYAGKGAPIREAWTTMAWVAAAQQESSFYIHFKWYEDFYGPPQRGDLYFVEREQDAEGEIRVRFLNMDFQTTLPAEEQERYASLWGRVSDNASDFFGESDYDPGPIHRILRLMEENPGRELEALDRWLDGRSDGEKALQCATLSAYFQGIQAIEEIIYNIVVNDRVGHAAQLHTRDLVDILNRIKAVMDVRRLPELAERFQRLAREFQPEPFRAPLLDREVGNALMEWTQGGGIRWYRLSKRSGRRFLRGLYALSDSRRSWDVFHRWQGEVYYTVFRRSPGKGLRRGVYLLSRFEDQTGLDVIDLFWLENIGCGVVHLCEGEFFEELLDLLLTVSIRETPLQGVIDRRGDQAAQYESLLRASFDKYTR